MKLTSNICSAYLRAVLDDVPQIDYVEGIKKMMLEASLKVMPASVRKVWDDEKTRCYVNTNWHYTPPTLGRSVGALLPIPTEALETPFLDCIYEYDRLKIQEALGRDRAQTEKLAELKGQLLAVIAGCNTRAQLATRLPEFAKYLPPERPTTKNLPALANVVSAFTAAGWPKTKQA